MALSQQAIARQRDIERQRLIDEENERRRLTLTPTRQYSWEVQRDRERALEARIEQLEQAYGRQTVAMAKLRERKGVALRDEVLDALGRFAKQTAVIHERVESTYGKVTKRTVIRVLRALEIEGLVRRVVDEGKWRRVQ